MIVDVETSCIVEDVLSTGDDAEIWYARAYLGTVRADLIVSAVLNVTLNNGLIDMDVGVYGYVAVDGEDVLVTWPVDRIYVSVDIYSTFQTSRNIEFSAPYDIPNSSPEVWITFATYVASSIGLLFL